MNQEAATEEYRRSCLRFFEVQDIDDGQLRTAEMKKLQQWWGMIVGKLKENEESGDPKVWYALGDAYGNARGVTRDRLAAISWFRRAAEAGHGHAMVRLGLFFIHTERPEEWPTAIQWFRKAAEQGEAAGMVHLGFAYREGKGVPADPAEAMNWFLKAVSAGDKHAIVHAGRIYEGPLDSPSEAAKSFLEAAEKSSSKPMVGQNLWPGLGVSDEDLEKKATWISRDDHRFPGALVMYFRTAGSLIRQSRYDFSFLSLALFQAVIGLERALKHHYRIEDATLKELLERAISDSVISEKSFSRAEPLPAEFQRRIENQKEPYVRQFAELVRTLRNEFFHGSYMLHPFQLSLALQVREATDAILQ